jgi:hypothetical protein
MTSAGARKIEHHSRVYEWVVRQRANEFRLVARDVVARGQLLVTRFPVYVMNLLNEPHGEYFTRTRISADLIRSKFAQAFSCGWRPTVKGLPPLQAGSARGWGPDNPKNFQLIDGLWTVLNAICRDPDWRTRLVHNTAEFVPVPPEYVRNLDRWLESRLADAGELVVYVRALDHGDTIPHLAIRSLHWGKDVVLEEISEWHQGWHREPLQ